MLPDRRIEPLLDPPPELTRRFLRRQAPQLRGAAISLLRRRMTPEQHGDWEYSKPIVIVDVIWNTTFVALAAAVLCMSLKEKPEVPVRLWITGYACQCLFHLGCVVFQYLRRISPDSNGNLSLMKYLESGNTLLSFAWWIAGFLWISAGGKSLIASSPHLYWVCVTFLAFDVVFVILCVAVACLVGIGVCCCLPCIIGVLYAVSEREGATSEDIESLPRYKFSAARGRSSADDAECCVCLHMYEDDVDLLELPCQHYFHAYCIQKWLYINATCPLCKLNVLKCCSSSDSDDV